MIAVILAGGAGTRLWPLSRRQYPKQFLKIDGTASLLQETVGRLLPVVGPHGIVIMTNAEYQFHVQADLRDELGPGLGERMVLEPCGRNTAPALALAAVFCRDRLGCSADEVLFVAPADHVIQPASRFTDYLRRAQEIAAAGHIVTFGIQPRRPDPAYGYIQAGEPIGADCFRVRRFTEKPDTATARKFLLDGNYYWNSGLFAFQLGVLLEELQRYAPAIAAVVEEGYARALEHFESMPNISIDYAVMEHSDRVVTLPVDLYWNDVGSWDALFEVRAKSADGNISVGDVLPVDTHDSLVLSGKRLIATIGISDLLVVETDDAVLIANRREAQKVKEVVERLKQEGRREADEHLTVYRPWGQYTTLECAERYRIKRVVVNPGEQLSLQMHYHRSEHWVVVRGTALVTIDGTDRLVHENESAYVAKSIRHRLANPGKVPLELIEVQNGEYVGEDDIVRFDDAYGRK